jgi:UDPglucose 6-dehydrogenase
MCADTYEALEGADVGVLLTEWNEFRALDLGRVRETLKTPAFVDLRNVYPIEEMVNIGIAYTAVGRLV